MKHSLSKEDAIDDEVKGHLKSKHILYVFLMAF